MEWILRFFESILSFYNEIAVYLLLGLGVAGLLHVFFPEEMVRRHLGRGTFLSVIKSTAVGIPLPLCSCGVVPVAASLRKSGASRGATVAFLTSTPQIGADSFLVTYSLLGPLFALFRITAAFITALVAGTAVNLLVQEEAKVSPATAPFPSLRSTETSFDRLKGLPGHIEFAILGPIANSLIAGILLAGAITALVPSTVFDQVFGNRYVSMGLMLLVGIPMYVCASASTPIAASLVFKGMSPGSALVFLLTGPATNMVTIATVTRTLGKKTAAIYLTAIAVISVGMGLLLDAFLAGRAADLVVRHVHGDMLPSRLLLSGSALLTLLLLIYYFERLVRPILRRGKGASLMSEKIILPVRGMTCMHCVANVRKAVASVPGASDITVDLDGAKVEFLLADPARLSEVREAIRAAGYEV